MSDRLFAYHFNISPPFLPFLSLPLPRFHFEACIITSLEREIMLMRSSHSQVSLSLFFKAVFHIPQIIICTHHTSRRHEIMIYESCIFSLTPLSGCGCLSLKMTTNTLNLHYQLLPRENHNQCMLYAMI